MDRKGYYKVIGKDDGLYITYSPKEDNGKDVSLEEYMSYLEKKGIDYGTVAELNAAMNEARENKDSRVKISGADVIPYSGWCDYSDSAHMKLTMIMYPPMGGAEPITVDEILSDLKNMGIVYGIKENVIAAIVKCKRYFEQFVIAEAQMPVEGKDARLVYNFNTEIKAKPTINENGTVDFHHLDMINHIKEGDVVAEIIPEDTGKDGINIAGAVIKPKPVARKSFKYGRNLEVSEDGLRLISKVTGHVSLEGDKIFVSDEYIIQTDVDTSTGDIEYDGNVKILGCVRAGFSVKATGNISVSGAVEGAIITAGKDVILERGIAGMNKGRITAGGDVIATFIENATVIAGNNLEADAILHSKVVAEGMIDVHGRNGYIIGGNVRASSVISARNIGSTMETVTVLAVGNNPEAVTKINELKTKIASNANDISKLTQVVTLLKQKLEKEGKLDSVKLEYLKKSLENLGILEKQQAECKESYLDLSSKLCEDKDAKIIVNGSIYPGVRLEFGEQVMFIREKNDFCRYVIKGMDITRVNN